MFEVYILYIRCTYTILVLYINKHDTVKSTNIKRLKIIVRKKRYNKNYLLK